MNAQRRTHGATPRSLAIALFLFAAPMSLAAQKVDVTGKWLFSVASEAGSGTPTVTLTQKGDSLTGHYSSQVFGEVELKGTVKDNKITFSINASAQGQAMVVTYSGTVESADAMKGTVDFGGYGSGTFSGTRQKP